MFGVKEQVFAFPARLPISKQNLVTFGNSFDVWHGKSIGGDQWTSESPNGESNGSVFY